MVNKMPVVGKRYKHKDLGKVVEFVGDREDGYFIAAEKTLKHYAGNYFLANFEEIPEDNLQKPEEVKVNETPNPVDLEKGEVNEVERALEELKKALLKPMSADLSEDVDKWWRDQYFLVCDAGWNFVNALEAEKLGNKKEILGDNLGDKRSSSLEASAPNKMSKPEPQIDMKEERVEPVSIWKDVGERLDKSNIPIETKVMFEIIAIYMTGLQKDIDTLKRKSI